MHHLSRFLVLFTTLITLQLPPTTASPISKRFIPLTTPTSISTTSFHPLVGPSPSQPSNTNFTILSDPRPQYPTGYGDDCKAICGLKKRIVSGAPATVTVTGRWITETDQDLNPGGIETPLDSPHLETPTQTIQDIGIQDVNTETVQGDNNVSPSDLCDCTSLHLVDEVTAYLLEELAKQNSTITTTNNTTTTTTTTTTPHPTETNTATSTSNDLSPSKISAIAVGSCILLLFFLLSVWAIVVIYRIIKSKRDRRVDIEKRTSVLSIDSLSVDEDEIESNASGFLGAGDVDEDQEVLISGTGWEVGTQNEVRVSQVGVAR